MTDVVGPSSLVDAEILACSRVLQSGYYVLGAEVEAFERTWAARCGSRFAVGVGNGMDAIEIGLRSLGIGDGDEVITTAMTAFATVLAILRCGAAPVFADISPDTAVLDPNSVESKITENTKAIVLVHLYGQAGPVDSLLALCESRNIKLVEDCAQAHLARFDDRPVGSIGMLGAWSFYPTKNLGAVGDAGAITTSDSHIASLSKQLRNYGQSNRYEHDVPGLNSRLDELQAAILSERLKYLTAWTERRRVIARKYQDSLESPHISPLTAPVDPESHVYHLFVVSSDHRLELQAHMERADVQTIVHYPVPAHRQFALGTTAGAPKLPATEAHAARCLSLPCHPGLSDEDVDRVIDVANEFRP